MVDKLFPGVFFVIPCVDVYEKIDMRTGTYEIPPQEVRSTFLRIMNIFVFQDPDQGLCDGICQRHHVLQGQGRHPGRGQCGRLQRLRQATGRHHPEECAWHQEPWGYSV